MLYEKPLKTEIEKLAGSLSEVLTKERIPREPLLCVAATKMDNEHNFRFGIMLIEIEEGSSLGEDFFVELRELRKKYSSWGR